MKSFGEIKDGNKIVYTPYGLKLINLSNLKKQSMGLLITRKTLDDTDLFLLPIVHNTKIGFIDLTGAVIIEPVYDSVVGDFINENSVVVVELNYKYGAINCSGEIVVPCEYMRIYGFNEGVTLARNFNYRYGFIDNQNKVVVEFGRFAWSESFVNGLARVILNTEDSQKWGIINPKGEFVLEAKYDDIRSFNEHTTSIRVKLNGEFEIISLESLRM